MKLQGSFCTLLAGAGGMHPWGEAQLLGPLQIAQANWPQRAPKALPHGPCYS